MRGIRGAQWALLWGIVWVTFKFLFPEFFFLSRSSVPLGQFDDALQGPPVNTCGFFGGVRKTQAAAGAADPSLSNHKFSPGPPFWLVIICNGLGEV